MRANGTARILATDESEGRDAITLLVARYPPYRDSHHEVRW